MASEYILILYIFLIFQKLKGARTTSKYTYEGLYIILYMVVKNTNFINSDPFFSLAIAIVTFETPPKA